MEFDLPRYSHISDCPLQENPHGSWTCPHCGWTYRKEVRRNCPAAADSRIDKGVQLVRAINELVSNGLASRCWAEIGRMLARCQGCDLFTGSGCTTFDGRDDRPDLLDVLTDRGRWCPRWGRK